MSFSAHTHDPALCDNSSLRPLSEPLPHRRVHQSHQHVDNLTRCEKSTSAHLATLLDLHSAVYTTVATN